MVSIGIFPPGDCELFDLASTELIDPIRLVTKMRTLKFKYSLIITRGTRARSVVVHKKLSPCGRVRSIGRESIYSI